MAWQAGRGLARQGEALTAANTTSARLASDLRTAATRNLQTEERERRRLAGELHDEFGQTLTAMQTHLKLAQPQFMDIARPDIGVVLNVGTAHLGEFGSRQAIAETKGELAVA